MFEGYAFDATRWPRLLFGANTSLAKHAPAVGFPVECSFVSPWYALRCSFSLDAFCCGCVCRLDGLLNRERRQLLGRMAQMRNCTRGGACPPRKGCDKMADECVARCSRVDDVRDLDARHETTVRPVLRIIRTPRTQRYDYCLHPGVVEEP